MVGANHHEFRYFLSSKAKKEPVTIAASNSATGKASQTPLIPKKLGKIYSKGIKKNP